MLQIITGKFFTTDDLIVTHHRGVLYSNYQPEYFKIINTPVGFLSSAETWGDNPRNSVCSLIYEYDERLEAVRPDGTKEFLVSVGGDYIIQDFAAVTAFALNITCSPDLSLVRRLTQSKHASLGVANVPDNYVNRVFNQRVDYSPDDESQLQSFISELVGLKRKTYKAAMRAIRRYVNGLHRIADDLDLAYALLVASIESLAQEFDAFAPTWEDYDQGKRRALDDALAGASDETAKKVRETILSQEHLSLARRYREFTLAHLKPAFFREEAVKETLPVNRPDLRVSLERAYQFRSKYVHSLHELPRNLSVSPTFANTINVEGKLMLTFHGLARVARHVIREFITRSLKVDRETFDYRYDLPNIVRVRLDESMWIWSHGGYNHNSARRYLNGFLNQLSRILSGSPGAAITDISAVVEKIETCVLGLAKAEQRLPMLMLYLLFHAYVPLENRRPNWEQLLEKYSKDLEALSIESMLIPVLTSAKFDWTPEEYSKIRDEYFKQRYNRNGLSFGPLIETAVTLHLAEIYRRANDEGHSRQFVSEAVENFPGHQKLLEFEQDMRNQSLPAIEWWKIMLPRKAVDSSDGAVESEEKAEQTKVSGNE